MHTAAEPTSPVETKQHARPANRLGERYRLALDKAVRQPIPEGFQRGGYRPVNRPSRFPMEMEAIAKSRTLARLWMAKSEVMQRKMRKNQCDDQRHGLRVDYHARGPDS